MTETKILHFKKPSDDSHRLAPSTCTEAETFALQVLDDCMEPEFRQGCIIVVDPTGHATDGSYVLAQQGASESAAVPATHSDAISDEAKQTLDTFLFRQLRRVEDGSWALCALNTEYDTQTTAQDLSEVVGVIVQRAGTRRRYHKRYD